MAIIVDGACALDIRANTPERWSRTGKCFALIPKKDRPMHEIILNEDGMVLFVSATYDADGEKKYQEIFGSDEDFIATYVPRSEITQLEVGLKR